MPEGGKNDPAQMFQQIMQQLTQGQGGAPDTFDFTSKPTAPVPGELIEFNFRQIEFDGSGNEALPGLPMTDALPGTVALPGLPMTVGRSDSNAEVNHSEFAIVKLLDAASPKVVDDGLLLPAVQDDGLLLPAVQTDNGLLLPY